MLSLFCGEDINMFDALSKDLKAYTNRPEPITEAQLDVF